jgi:hypothetical protein
VIPEDIRRFVLTSIPSIPYLEAALLFLGAPARERSPGELAQALYIPEPKAAALLVELQAAGILAAEAEESRYRYAPQTEALGQALEKLAATYASDVIGITHLVHEHTGKNAQRFADAFRLRKEP